MGLGCSALLRSNVVAGLMDDPRSSAMACLPKLAGKNRRWRNRKRPDRRRGVSAAGAGHFEKAAVYERTAVDLVRPKPIMPKMAIKAMASEAGSGTATK